ncbi:MarR family transcriptional regulator [Pseudonocardia sp. ICBG1293]|uniref:MarR family transcriptional regulator n=1 Tax=Pseudonocardia sp. ICBG1293 TaxID=2844382 RepID=UPI001CCD1003|nr:MarR family transcriptional regulator [Pseudonocardia sp. ICBG1293]
MGGTDGRDRDHPDGATVEAGLALARAFTGISVRAVAAAGDLVTVPQLRVLLLIADAGRTNVAAVGRELDVHPSNATRVLVRLGRAGLVDRRPDPEDRRHLIVELTPAGRELIRDVDAHRRAAVAELLARVPAGRRAGAAELLAALADAATAPTI